MTTTMQTLSRPVGTLLRRWRERRRLSQLDLALQALPALSHAVHLRALGESPVMRSPIVTALRARHPDFRSSRSSILREGAFNFAVRRAALASLPWCAAAGASASIAVETSARRGAARSA